MPRYAVSSFNYITYELFLSFVQAENWKDALEALGYEIKSTDYIDAQDEADSQDWCFEIKEIK